MVAAVFADKNRFSGKEIDVASVDIAMSELAETFSRTVNRPVRHPQILFGRFREQTGEESARIFTWFETVGYSANLTKLEKMFFPLSSVDDYPSRNWGTG